MKITELNQQNQINPYLNQTQQTQIVQRQRDVQQTNRQQGGLQDKVEISTRSKILQSTDRIKNILDTNRSQKVQEIAAQVQQNTYKINPAKVAGAMMKDLIKDLG
ncbi:MAG: flagellar biosynthesis anti-sigma factor FlgM [Dissulfurimicrobium sp.]|uniref:flagellar biosynthesis anti-sigma factor FlgM n=1 Tax=Dissulfurimicrobium TaxID=1769732 RepID=UPI001EDA2984|nr:flagellar biosynthesis anti-sigma factor FlgM [Dissulfurimicrobium hydrothermale]UKL13273.1 flagellar biosynthesis anti-sigma factor FlgM [Dissulfurimicrobium hydrothermale]